MQAAYTEESMSHKGFSLLGTAKPASHSVRLITNNVSLLVSNDLSNGGTDTCSFYSGPSDATILSFAEQAESCGSIAYSGGSESCGSIAYSGSGESCGSVASSSSFSGGGCSYCC